MKNLYSTYNGHQYIAHMVDVGDLLPIRDYIVLEYFQFDYFQVELIVHDYSL